MKFVQEYCCCCFFFLKFVVIIPNHEKFINRKEIINIGKATSKKIKENTRKFQEKATTVSNRTHYGNIKIKAKREQRD